MIGVEPMSDDDVLPETPRSLHQGFEEAGLVLHAE